MWLPAVLVISSDAAWRNQVVGTLRAAEVLTYSVLELGEAIRFLKAGVEPLLVVLDARKRAEAEAFLAEQHREPELRELEVVAVSEALEKEKLPRAEPRPWLPTDLARMEQTVRQAITRILQARA
jgi:hypothetical protein